MNHRPESGERGRVSFSWPHRSRFITGPSSPRRFPLRSRSRGVQSPFVHRELLWPSFWGIGRLSNSHRAVRSTSVPTHRELRTGQAGAIRRAIITRSGLYDRSGGRRCERGLCQEGVDRLKWSGLEWTSTLQVAHPTTWLSLPAVGPSASPAASFFFSPVVARQTPQRDHSAAAKAARLLGLTPPLRSLAPKPSGRGQGC